MLNPHARKAVRSGAIEARVALEVKPASARTARQFVAATLRSWECQSDVVDAAVLLTSELVTNALLHAHGPIELSVIAAPTTLRVEVVDGSANVPVRRDHPDDAMTGRGLTLVEALAERWGTDVERRGKRVWFEVRT